MGNKDTKGHEKAPNRITRREFCEKIPKGVVTGVVFSSVPGIQACSVSTINSSSADSGVATESNTRANSDPTTDTVAVSDSDRPTLVFGSDSE